ncbi:MAG TPA: GIY-YIG nuclease family protein [Patescibacteria group bacterium]
MLKLENGYYTGFTANLKKRFFTHKNKLVSSTRSKNPSEIVFFAGFNSKIKAIQFEKYLKTGSGFAFRNKHLV